MHGCCTPQRLHARAVRYHLPVSAPLARLRRQRRWLLLLAPFLLLRGIIPAGFMPVAAAEGFIGLCPGAVAMPAGMAMPGHSGHAHHGEGMGAQGGGHAAPCPFAQSATAAGVPQVPQLAAQQLAAGDVPATAAAGVRVPAIVRAQSPRGPPLLHS